MDDIYSGIRILDLTKVFSGPFCARLFADYGAEVIKIEAETVPDDSRQYPPVKNGHSGYFEMLNRNKKIIPLNLKLPEDLRTFYQLCTTADVIIENLTPETKFSLRIDYKTVSSYKPDIIYASLSGLGQDNQRKYYDVLAQAESGLMSLSGTPEMPMKIGPSVVDAFTGLMLAYGIAGALHFRSKTGKGQELDVSMLGCAMQLLESNLTEASMVQKNPARTGNQDNLISPFGVYSTADGYIALAAGNSTQWNALSDFLLTTDPFDRTLFDSNDLRLAHADALTKLLERVFHRYTTGDLLDELQKRNIACAPVNGMLDVLSMGQLFASGDLVRIVHPKLGPCVVPGKNIRYSAVQK